MNKTNLIIGGVVVALALSCLAYFSPHTVTQVVKETVGSSVGPENTSDYVCYNGLCTKYARISPTFKSATTTVCALRAQQFAKNSTIDDLRLNIAVGTSSAMTLVIATSSNPFSTTTQTGPIVPDYTIPASFTGGFSFKPFLTSTSTVQAGLSMPANILSKSVLAANEYVLFILEGSNQSGFGGTLSTSIKGTCDAIIREF